MPPAKLSEAQIAEALTHVSEWSEVGETIQRTYQFRDFMGSMKFVNEVAARAEAGQHHPDILIRFSRVTLTLATHDAGGITEKDFALAKQADALAAGNEAPKIAATAPKKKAKSA
jgi:4a-hydroxytetrahydrobiopterin dehydratase